MIRQGNPTLIVCCLMFQQGSWDWLQKFSPEASKSLTRVPGGSGARSWGLDLALRCLALGSWKAAVWPLSTKSLFLSSPSPWPWPSFYFRGVAFPPEGTPGTHPLQVPSTVRKEKETEPNRTEPFDSGTGRNRTRNRTEPNRTEPRHVRQMGTCRPNRVKPGNLFFRTEPNY